MLGTLLAFPVLLATTANPVAPRIAPAGGEVLLAAVGSSSDAPLPLEVESPRVSTTVVLRRSASAFDAVPATLTRFWSPASAAPLDGRWQAHPGHIPPGATRGPPGSRSRPWARSNR